MVIKHIPVPFSILSKMLNKELADLRARYQTEKDNTIVERINQDINNPDVEIPAVSQIDCENPSRVLTATVTAYNSHTVSYKWSQTETISTITVSVGGPYSVTVTDDVNKCSAVASVVVAQSSDLPTVTIPAVSDLNCQTTQTVLVVNVEGAANIKYEWNTGGSTTSTSNVTEGEYKVTVTNLDENNPVSEKINGNSYS